MPLKTVVKIGNITNLSDARYCAGMGVAMLGFTVIEGKENFISPAAYQEIRGWVSGPLFVAEIYGLKKELLLDIIENYNPDLLELGVEDLVHLPEHTSLPLILSIDEKNFKSHQAEINLLKSKIAYLQVTQPVNNFLENISNDFSVLLALKQTIDVQRIIETSAISGIALNGSQEIKPGLKNYDDLAAVLEQLDTD